MGITVKEFLNAYCGKIIPVSLWDYTTEEEYEEDSDIFEMDDGINNSWKNAEIKDWEIIDGTMNLNVIREV